MDFQGKPGSRRMHPAVNKRMATSQLSNGTKVKFDVMKQRNSVQSRKTVKDLILRISQDEEATNWPFE